MGSWNGIFLPELNINFFHEHLKLLKFIKLKARFSIVLAESALVLSGFNSVKDCDWNQSLLLFSVTQLCLTLHDPMDSACLASLSFTVSQSLLRLVSMESAMHPTIMSSVIPFSSVQSSRSVMSDSLWPHGLQHTRLPCPSAAAAKSLQSCLTLCDPIDDNPPGSPVPGIFQARTLEWVAISFSNAWKWKVKVKSLSRVRLLATPWTAAYQAPPSMGFSRQEY